MEAAGNDEEGLPDGSFKRRAHIHHHNIHGCPVLLKIAFDHLFLSVGQNVNRFFLAPVADNQLILSFLRVALILVNRDDMGQCGGFRKFLEHQYIEPAYDGRSRSAGMPSHFLERIRFDASHPISLSPFEVFDLLDPIIVGAPGLLLAT